MKTRWALLSAAIFFGFLSNQMIAAEGVLGQGNISCDSWIKSRGDGNPVVAARTAWVLGDEPAGRFKNGIDVGADHLFGDCLVLFAILLRLADRLQRRTVQN